MNTTISGILVVLLACSVQGKLVKNEIEYKLDTVSFKGYLVWDNAATGKRPGMLLVHEWWGLNDFVKDKADELAKMGYIAFAADLYGNGRTTADPQIAAKMAGE
ncbi:MAG: dienelactone hydrolase family protein, partial [Chitinispirillaceae bacterium]|nr:dienelactone hydrolase family protein [Chitinispirillaceae bacterium]